MKISTKWLLSSMALAALSACGGGGSSGGTPEPVQTATTSIFTPGQFAMTLFKPDGTTQASSVTVSYGAPQGILTIPIDIDPVVQISTIDGYGTWSYSAVAANSKMLETGNVMSLCAPSANYTNNRVIMSSNMIEVTGSAAIDALKGKTFTQFACMPNQIPFTFIFDADGAAVRYQNNPPVGVNSSFSAADVVQLLSSAGVSGTGSKNYKMRLFKTSGSTPKYYTVYSITEPNEAAITTKSVELGYIP